jgi:hypothetical protein
VKTVDEIREPAFALLHPIFRECCDPDSPRLSLGAPFLAPGPIESITYAIATDGRIIVWCHAPPALVELLQGCEPRRVPYTSVLELTRHRWGYDRRESELPELPGPIECHRCNGTGPIAGACHWCGGKGRLDPSGRVHLGRNILIGLRYADMLKRNGAAIYLSQYRDVSIPVKFVIRSLTEPVTGLLMQVAGGE